MAGSSTPKKFASLFLIFVLNITRMELALNASRDMTLKTEDVPSLNPTMPSPLTPDVEPGTGTTKSAFHAPTDGSSTQKRPACPFPTNARLTITTELASPATRDMTSRKEHVSSLTQITPSPPILDAVSGTGTTKSVSHALRDGLPTLTRSACPFLTNAPQAIALEPALLATRDTNLLVELVSSLPSTMLTLLTPGAVSGIGITKFASPAPMDGSSTPTKSAFLSLISVPATIATVLA